MWMSSRQRVRNEKTEGHPTVFVVNNIWGYFTQQCYFQMLQIEGCEVVGSHKRHRAGKGSRQWCTAVLNVDCIKVIGKCIV